ncbi:MAG: phosphate ABC transporter substrate-binding protein PstS [Propionibacteriaceae bacterium]|jgi:phosphate transport system substrate-binding protein|nr:phosphate ABC transporter substrate-binding protein PstS [Propionibacteriaceae bacterium]
MKMFNALSRAGIAALALGAILSGCAANEAPVVASDTPTATDPATPPAPAIQGTLVGGGASSQTAAQEAWRAGFQTTYSAVTVDYDPTGSGVGRTNFSEGGFAFVGTDDAYSVEEAAGNFAGCVPGSGLVEIPVYISPIAVAFNLPELATLNLDPSTLADIFAGRIKKWDDKAIAAANPGVKLPSTPVTAVHRSDKSGTTGNFTDYLAETAPAEWTWGSVEEWPKKLTGEAAEKTQGVREAITAAAGAIGYLDASQASDLGTVSIKVGSEYVAPSAEGAATAVANSSLEQGRAATDIVFDLDRKQGTGYPLLLVSYLGACVQYQDSNTATLVRSYLEHAVSTTGQQAAAQQAGSAPLNTELTSLVSDAISKIK